MAVPDEIIDVEATELVPYVAPAPPSTLFRTEDPREVVVRATETAKPLAEVIRKQKLFKKIGDKNHVLVEGWTLLGSMLGVVPICVWTRQLENGWEARVEARTLDGRIVGAAEAMCLRSEALWKGRDEYAIRSMAQTRATSKALRQPLGFVIQLAGFAPEPVEEVEDTATAKSAGEPSGKRRTKAPPKTPAAAEASSEERTAASPAEDSGQGAASDSAGAPERGAGEAATGDEAPTPSPFTPPTGPRGGQSNQIEANELATKLVALVEKIGATDSLTAVEEHREAADIPWLKRQTASIEKHLERQEEKE